MAIREKTSMATSFSVLTQDFLDQVAKKQKLSHPFSLVLPSAGIPVHQPPPSTVGVYYQFVVVGLRFPAFPFLGEICNFYKLHVCQINPNGLRKIICFMMLNKALGHEPDLEIFRYFYTAMIKAEWVSFSSRPSLTELCADLPDVPRGWKEEFFFIDSRAFPFSMTMGPVKDTPSDAKVTLSPDKMNISEDLAANSISFEDPSETTVESFYSGDFILGCVALQLSLVRSFSFMSVGTRRLYPVV